VLGTAPIFLLREAPKTAEETGAALSIIGFAPKAPLLLAAVALFSIIDSAYLAFLPVYAVKKGLDAETASLALTVFIVGNSVLQFPIGWLADHVSKRAVMAGCAIASAIGSALVPASFGTPAFWIVLLVTGTAAAGIYSVALSELGERFSGSDLMAGTASFSAIWGAGALVGALIGGWSFQEFGPDGLPYTVAVVFTVFIVMMFSGRALRSA
jgi:MFS family permease